MLKRKNIFEDDSDYDAEVEVEKQPQVLKEESKSDSSSEFGKNKVSLNFELVVNK
jgi:hypothetical protein